MTFFLKFVASLSALSSAVLADTNINFSPTDLSAQFRHQNLMHLLRQDIRGLIEHKQSINLQSNNDKMNTHTQVVAMSQGQTPFLREFSQVWFAQPEAESLSDVTHREFVRKEFAKFRPTVSSADAQSPSPIAVLELLASGKQNVKNLNGNPLSLLAKSQTSLATRLKNFTMCDFECLLAGIATYWATAVTCVGHYRQDPVKAILCLTAAAPPLCAGATYACLKVNPQCKSLSNDASTRTAEELVGLLYGLENELGSSSSGRIFGIPAEFRTHIQTLKNDEGRQLEVGELMKKYI